MSSLFIWHQTNESESILLLILNIYFVNERFLVQKLLISAYCMYVFVICCRFPFRMEVG